MRTKNLFASINPLNSGSCIFKATIPNLLFSAQGIPLKREVEIFIWSQIVIAKAIPHLWMAEVLILSLTTSWNNLGIQRKRQKSWLQQPYELWLVFPKLCSLGHYTWVSRYIKVGWFHNSNYLGNSSLYMLLHCSYSCANKKCNSSGEMCPQFPILFDQVLVIQEVPVNIWRIPVFHGDTYLLLNTHAFSIQTFGYITYIRLLLFSGFSL